jgi:hypothetical protein
MEEWRYGSTILDLGTRWGRTVSFPPQLLYPRIKSPCIPCKGGWVAPRAGMDTVERKIATKHHYNWY